MPLALATVLHAVEETKLAQRKEEWVVKQIIKFHDPEAQKDDWVNNVACSLQKKRLVDSRYKNNTMRVWDTENGELLTRLTDGNGDHISVVALDSNGEILAAVKNSDNISYGTLKQDKKSKSYVKLCMLGL